MFDAGSITFHALFAMNDSLRCVLGIIGCCMLTRARQLA